MTKREAVREARKRFRLGKSSAVIRSRKATPIPMTGYSVIEKGEALPKNAEVIYQYTVKS